MKKWFALTLLTILLAILARFLLVAIPASGALKTLDSKLVESCSRVDIFAGTEDVAIDYATNLVFVSGSDRRNTSHQDGIFAFPLDSQTQVKRVSPANMEDFHPHGISLWSGMGETRLFVISHQSTGNDVVEIFVVGKDGMLEHAETVSFAAMHSPNDLVAVGARQFYASNDRGVGTGIVALAEQYLALPLSSAVYFDSMQGRVVAEGLVSANGINQSPDGKTIYIAEALGSRVAVYKRDLTTGALTKQRQIAVGTAADNIDVDPAGVLWIAGHSKVFDFLAHAQDADKIAPSHIIKLNPASDEIEDVFLALNGEINAASVGAVHNNTLVVGAVFDGHVMVCPL